MRSKHVLLLAFTAIACLASTSACQPPGTDSVARTGTGADSESRVRVSPIKPVRKTLVRYSDQPGRISAFEEAPIWAKVSGYARKVHVDIGDRVIGPAPADQGVGTPGQLLVELDIPELHDELAQKEAAVEQCESEVRQGEAAIKVSRAKLDSANAHELEAKAMVGRAEADRERWKSELERISDLAARQAVTEKLVDETRSKLAAAQAQLEEVDARIRSARAEVAEADSMVAKAEADLEAVRARLKSAHADRDRARTMIQYGELRAPFDGVISARNVDVGHLVEAGASTREPLLYLVDTTTVRVIVDVPEVDAVHVEAGAEATVRVASLGTQGFVGKIARTTWSLNQATRTLRVEIDIPNDEGKLRPGMYAHARIKVAQRDEVLTLPKTALLAGGGDPTCWVIEPTGQLKKRLLELGLEADGQVEVTSGLDGTEDVIGVNASAFRDGQAVERVTPPR